LDFALLTTSESGEIESQVANCKAIAMAKNRPDIGLIVASAKSDVRSISDIAGKRFAFGPRGDAVYHYGAAAALTAAGVTLDKIKRELIPINTLQYHLDPTEAAKEVAFGATPAGVISKSEFDRYPDSGGRLFPLSFSKDQFRVLGETPTVEYGPVIASARVDAETVDKVRSFLLDVGDRYPDATRSMLIAGFTGVPPERTP
jgi:ABC-type phosphate/phosphonate transport system substrate-binding protein